ncbi:cell division control protein, partial [Ascosphaera acerosa]
SIIPFAIVGSEKTLLINGKQVRGRANRWGVINVEDETHCEFVYLRNFLTRTHLQDLIETTSQIHYETFRAKQLLALRENTSAAAAAAAAATTGTATPANGPAASAATAAANVNVNGNVTGSSSAVKPPPNPLATSTTVRPMTLLGSA